MTNDLFIMLSGLGTAIMLYWGCTRLPREQWQILAAVPVARSSGGTWRGLNITYYGLFSANAYLAGAALFIILTGSSGFSLPSILLLTGIVLLFCIPASAFIARVVENKPSVFTVAGGFFTGMIVLPASFIILKQTPAAAVLADRSAMPLLAAAGIAYSFAAGIGTLACMSFGCCYGKPLAQCGSVVQKLFGSCSFVFTGKTKKISYAQGLDAIAVFPVQAVTAVLYTGAALIAMRLFLHGSFHAAFLLTVFTTQAWRFISEFLRADYRGGGKISAYQTMALISIVFALIAASIADPVIRLTTDICLGLQQLWKPEVILLLQMLWAGTFLFTGRSSVTGSAISFFINKDRI